MNRQILAAGACALTFAAVGIAWAQQSGFAGQYTPTRGEVSARITQSSGGYHAAFETGSPASRCGGSVEGAARVSGNSLTLEAPWSDGQRRQICRVTLTRQGSGYAVSESNCSYFHGASCAFTGSMQRASQSVRWNQDGMAIENAWVDEYDLAWVQDSYGNDLVLGVTGCREQSYDIQLGGLQSVTLKPMDGNGRALATITLRRDEVARLRAVLRPSDVSALRSASRIELTASSGTTYFSGRGSSRVIDTLQCMT